MAIAWTRPIFDWLGRPFEQLRERLESTRRAARQQIEAVRQIFAEREALLRQDPQREGEATSLERRSASKQLDLRVRSALVREGGAAPIRQEMAEMVSRLGQNRQLDAVSDRAYELIAAAESLLALLRGDGWVFAHRDVLAADEEAEQALAAYRLKLEQAGQELEAKANKLAGHIERHLRYYQVARVGMIALLVLGPLLGVWSGLQLSEKNYHDIPSTRVPGQVAEGIDLLARGERLAQVSGQPISGVPWLDGSPEEQVALLRQELDSDFRWSTLLCRSLPPGKENGDAQLALTAQCNELLVRADQARLSLKSLGDVLHEQEGLRAGLVAQMIAALPRPPGAGVGATAPAPSAAPPRTAPPTPAAPAAAPEKTP